MVSSIKNLKNEIDSRLITGGLDALACCQLQGAQTILNNNIVYSVPNLASLPSVALNEGRLVYVDDINEYRYSDGLVWSDNLSSEVAIYSREIYGWGGNNCGQLGDGTTVSTRCSAVREISSSTDWCKVSTGNGRTSAGIKSTGQIWSWGYNNSRLGDGTTEHRCSPVREFCSATDWCDVNVGYRHTAAIKTTGQLWAWGCNTCGGLGFGGLSAGNTSPVREFCSAADWCRVTVGRDSTGAVKTTGQLWTWGGNFCGLLGDGTSVTRCSPVREFCSAADWCGVSLFCYYVAAIKTSGQIWAWGNNTFCQLGDGTSINRCSPVREFCSATDWCQVSAGNAHTVAIKTTGQLWAWGSGNCGRLGDGTTNCRSIAVREFCSATDWCQVSAGGGQTAAIKTSGQIWSWGLNSSFQLGDGTTVDRCRPVPEISSRTNWCGVSAGNVSTLAIASTPRGFLE